MLKKFLLSFLLLTALAASAATHEEVLSTTDNDDNNEIYQLVVSVDNDTRRLVDLFKDTFVEGTRIRRDVLNSEDLKTSEGMILEKRANFNVLNLKSNNFDHERGGHIVIDTLYNGVTGERKQYDVDLTYGTDRWQLYKNGKPISKFHVYVNKVIIFGKVGVKTIIME